MCHCLFRLALVVVAAVLAKASNVILQQQQQQQQHHHALNMHTLLQVHVTVELRVVHKNRDATSGSIIHSRSDDNNDDNNHHHFPLDDKQRQWILSIDEVSMIMPATTTDDDADAADDYRTEDDDEASLVEMDKHLSLSWSKMTSLDVLHEDNVSDQTIVTAAAATTTTIPDAVWLGTATVSIILPLVAATAAPFNGQQQQRRRPDQTPLTRTLVVALWEEENVVQKESTTTTDGGYYRTFLSRTLTHVPRMVVVAPKGSSPTTATTTTRSGSMTSAAYTRVAIKAVSTVTTSTSHHRGSASTTVRAFKTSSSIFWGKSVMVRWSIACLPLLLAVGLACCSKGWTRKHVPWRRRQQHAAAPDGQDEMALDAQDDDDQEQQQELETPMEEHDASSSSGEEEENSDDDDGQEDEQDSVEEEEEESQDGHDEHDDDDDSSPHHSAAATHPTDTLLPQLEEDSSSSLVPGVLLPPRFRSVPQSVRAHTNMANEQQQQQETDNIELPPTMERLVVRPLPSQGITFESEMERFNRLNLAASPSTTNSSHSHSSRGNSNRQYWPSANATLPVPPHHHQHQPPVPQQRQEQGGGGGQSCPSASVLAWNDPFFTMGGKQAGPLLPLPPPPVSNPWTASDKNTATTTSGQKQPLLSYRPCSISLKNSSSSINTQKGAAEEAIPSFVTLADSSQATSAEQAEEASSLVLLPTFFSPVAVAGDDSTTVTLSDQITDCKKKAAVSALSTELFGEEKTIIVTASAAAAAAAAIFDSTIVAREQEKTAATGPEPLQHSPIAEAAAAGVAANRIADKEDTVKVVESKTAVDNPSHIELAENDATLGATRVVDCVQVTTRDSSSEWPVPILHDDEQKAESIKPEQSCHVLDNVVATTTQLVNHPDVTLAQTPVTSTMSKAFVAVDDKKMSPSAKSEHGTVVGQAVHHHHPLLSALKSSSSTNKQPKNDTCPQQYHDAGRNDIERMQQQQQREESQPTQPACSKGLSIVANDGLQATGASTGTALVQPKSLVQEAASLDKTKDATHRPESKESTHHYQDGVDDGAKSSACSIVQPKSSRNATANETTVGIEESKKIVHVAVSKAVLGESNQESKSPTLRHGNDPSNSEATADAQAIQSAQETDERRGLKRSLDEIEDGPLQICPANNKSMPLTENALAGTDHELVGDVASLGQIGPSHRLACQMSTASVNDERSASDGQPDRSNQVSNRGYSTSTYASTLTPDSHTTVARLDDQWPFTKSSDKTVTTNRQATTKEHSVKSISFEKLGNWGTLPDDGSRTMTCVSRVTTKQPEVLQEVIKPRENLEPDPLSTTLASHASVASVNSCTGPMDGLCTTDNPDKDIGVEPPPGPCKPKLPVVPASVASTKSCADDLQGSLAGDNSVTKMVAENMETTTDAVVTRTEGSRSNPSEGTDNESVQVVEPPPGHGELKLPDAPLERKVAIQETASGPSGNGEEDDSVQVVEPPPGLPAVPLDDILPEFIPSISLQRAAQRVQAPVWQMSAAEAETITSSVIQPSKSRSRRTTRAAQKARRSSKAVGSQSQSGLNPNARKIKREQMHQNEDDARSSDLPAPPANLRSRSSRQKWLAQQKEDKSTKAQPEKQEKKKRSRSKSHDSSTDDSDENDRLPSPKRKKTGHSDTGAASSEVVTFPPPGAPTKKMKSIQKTSQSTLEAPSAPSKNKKH